MSETVELSGSSAGEQKGRTVSKADVDIAIIGAGPGGLYTAWRLLQDPSFKTKKIRLFEASDRVGGRVLSLKLPEVPYVLELGAMRYTTKQVLVHALIEKCLKLKAVDFKFDTSGFQLRDRVIPNAAFAKVKAKARAKGKARAAATKIPYYGLKASERSKSPVDLIVLGIQRSLQKLSLPDVETKAEASGVSVAALRTKLKALDKQISPGKLFGKFDDAEWRLIKRYGYVGDRPLYRLGFWDLVQQELSPEAYNLAHDGCGYQSILSMWNAADAIRWFLSDFDDVKYRTIASGMGTLNERLHADIQKFCGDRGVVALGWALHSIKAERQDDNQLYRLTFKVGEFTSPLGKVDLKSITAEKVILALPQPALKRLQIEGLQVLPNDTDAQAAFRFQTLLDTVTANPLFKAFTIYEQPWWPNKNSKSCFRVYTDLPVRQVYHLGKSRQCKELRTRARHAKMRALLFYSDARYAEYWKGLEQMTVGDEPYYKETFRTAMNDGQKKEFDKELKAYGTGDTVRARIHDQLNRVSGKKAPDALTIVVKHWSDPPYYAGWHSWNMGWESWKIAAQMVRPFVNAEVFTCGEAFSSEQGWIEGALQSAEQVLSALKVGPPKMRPLAKAVAHHGG